MLKQYSGFADNNYVTEVVRTMPISPKAEDRRKSTVCAFAKKKKKIINALCREGLVFIYLFKS